MGTKKNKQRNARSRRRLLSRLPDPPDWKTTAASAAGGGGGALLGGWLANRGWDPQMVGITMIGGGVVGALATEGPLRVVANGIAAAGAGQLALATMHKSAVKQVQQAIATNADKPSNAAFPPAVTDEFGRRRRLAAQEIDDEERMTDPDVAYDAA